jgi:hypothetical protein
LFLSRMESKEREDGYLGRTVRRDSEDGQRGWTASEEPFSDAKLNCFKKKYVVFMHLLNSIHRYRLRYAIWRKRGGKEGERGG